MVPDYPSTELRQSSEKTKQQKIRIPRSKFFLIWNCNQKSSILNLNKCSKDGKYSHCYKKNNQKSVLIKKENFESLVLKKLCQKVPCKCCTPLCSPPFLAPLTLPFKNFNKATCTTYYIKKAAANFSLNKILPMLNAYFCFSKKLFYRFIAFITNFSDIKKITGLPNFF